MFEKFKKLNILYKIPLVMILVIIGFMFLPITIVVLSVNLLLKGIKTKKVVKIIGGAILTMFTIWLITPSNSSVDETTTEKPQEQVQELSDYETVKPKEEPVKTEVFIYEEETEKEPVEEGIKKEPKEEIKEEIKEEPVKEEPKVEKNPFGAVMEKPVMNGIKTERIGTYAEVLAGGVEINKKNLLAFYNNVVKDSGYNWVTLNINDKKGVVFPGSNWIFDYGDIDNEGCITKSNGTGMIIGDTIEYEVSPY